MRPDEPAIVSNPMSRRLPPMWRARVRRLVSGTAYETPHWMRVAENQTVDSFLEALGPERLSAVEVSGTNSEGFGWKSYTNLHYPEFDLLAPHDVGAFDVVLCRHVLEHVLDPWKAMRTLAQLAKPGGHVIVTTPFLVKIHRDPRDLWRFTDDGMRVLMEQAGLELVEIGGWGNAWAVALNARIWVADRRILRRFGMHNNPATPMVVWGIARRPDSHASD